MTSKVTWGTSSRAGKYSPLDGQLSSESTTRYTLNRMTLSLKINEEKANGQVRKWEYQCEMYTSNSEFKSMLVARKLDMQHAIDEQMKDNEIYYSNHLSPFSHW